MSHMTQTYRQIATDSGETVRQHHSCDVVPSLRSVVLLCADNAGGPPFSVVVGVV